MTSIVLRASAAVVDGTGALLSVRYKGVERASVEVRSSEASDHRLELGTAVDGDSLELVFSNATDSQGRPLRHLHIESLQIGSAVLRATDSIASFDRGAGAAAFDEVDLHPGQSTLVDSGSLRFRLPAAAALAATDEGTPAPGFYVDAVNGSDSQPGSYAQPWRTLARASGVRLQPGQGLYLRCGNVWRESLKLEINELQDGSTVAGYGRECLLRKAVISGADDFSGGWQKSGSLWSRSLPAGTPRISQLFVNGQALRTAAWTDAGSTGRAWALVGNGRGSQTRLPLQPGDAASLAGKDLVGATVQVRTQPWLVETRRVVATAADALELDTALTWPLDAGEGFVLQDKLWMLDAPGEFFHDTSTQRLYLMPPATGTPLDLNTARIEGSVRDKVLTVSQRADLLIRDIAVYAGRELGLHIVDARQARVVAIEAHDNGVDGLQIEQWQAWAANAPGPSVSDSRFAGNSRHGLLTVNTERATVQRNRVWSTGSLARHQAGTVAAISTGASGRIEDNRIDGTGYLGIVFSPQGGSVVARNHVTGYCQRLSDCAALYTWAGRALATSPQSSTIEGNRIGPAAAALVGAVGNGREAVAGVYLDDFVRNAQVRNNVVAGAPAGVFLHNASDVTVEGNRIWLPKLAGLWASMDKTDADWLSGNVLRNNEIVPLVTATSGTGPLPSFNTSQAVWFWHATAGEAALAAGRNAFAGNTVAQLQGPLSAHALVRGPAGERELDALAWRQLNPAETAPSRPARFEAVSLSLGPELLADGDFSAGLGRWQSYVHPQSVGFAMSLTPALAGCTGACVSFTSGHVGDLMANWPVNLRAGASYLYRWTAVMPASSGATVGESYIGRLASPYDNMADATGYVSYGPRRGGAGETLDHETFFVAKSADTARLNLQLETLGVTVGLDNVSVREVTGFTPAAPAAWSAMVFATADAPRSVGCAELGWSSPCTALGLDGQAVSLPLTLPAGGQRLLLRADSPLRR